MNKEEIVISLDTDWAPAEVVDYSLSLLSKYEVTATFFMTNELDLDFKRHEIAIHPNFLSSSKKQSHSIDVDENERNVLDDLLSKFPESKGARTHSLYYFNRLNNLFSDFGIKYISNIEMPFQSNIEPFLIRNNILQFPIYFMDDFLLKNKKYFPTKYKNVFNSTNYVNGKVGLKVFDFHPIHIFINSASEEHYQQCKEHYHNPKALEKLRFKGQGIGTLFEDILKLLANNKIKFNTLSKLEEVYRSK